jgi:hypothetical protein
MNTKREQSGQIEIGFTYRRHLGARMESGSVKLRFDSLQPYSFSSSVMWSGNTNYENHIQAGVEKALKEKTGSLHNTKVELIEIEIDEIDSTAHGFESAAYAATCTAFLV